ncbi:unnamed protein product [Rhizophagus irregularis]|nr:unnamed protein product [Rhizophagus irregularis]
MDHKGLSIKIKLKKRLMVNKTKQFNDIKKELKFIKLEPEDWDVIADKVEERLIDTEIEHINREEIWEKLVNIYDEERKDLIKQIKKKREEEKLEKINKESKGTGDTLTNEEKLENLINEYERLEKIDKIEHEIIKTTDKVIKEKWRRRDVKDYKYSVTEFDKRLIIEEWGTTDTGKHNATKILKLIQQHDKLEEKLENSINIDKLRKNEFRKNLKEREIKRAEKMRTIYEEINEKTIEINIKKREIYLEEDIGKMINRILEKKREKIDMSGLIIKENGKFSIEKNQELIKEKVYNHNRKWTKKRQIDLDEIEYNQDWREIYSPREDIDERIYHNLMSPIKREELDKVISGLKSNKAPGMSSITYDFWKKSKDLTRTIILEIFNESLMKANVTDKWKKGVIYPINKTTRSHWNYDLKLTRPIVLLETARKICFKILTNRLSEILTKEQILTNTNYAALKNESTLEPLKIVQAVIEDANKYKKEAWILLMDISKAYDSASSTMLKKCMERIKLPKKFIDLVIDVNLNRYNRVLVNNELTEEYHVVTPVCHPAVNKSPCFTYICSPRDINILAWFSFTFYT